MKKNAIIWSVIAVALVVLIVGATILYNSLAKDYKPNNVVVLSSSQKETASTEASSEEITSKETTSKETSTTSEKTASKVKPSSEVKLSSTAETSSEETVDEPNFYDFTVVDKNGKDVALSKFLGKPIVINFWTSWCGYCVREMPDFDKAAKKYTDVEFVMVNATADKRETEEKAKDYIKDNKFTLNFYFDMYKDAVFQYGITSYPTTFFLDSKGNIVSYSAGSLDYDGLVDCIEMIRSVK